MLYVGRLSPHKGVHLLIKTLGLVKERIPEATLVIVGKHTFDGYSKKLERMSKGVVFAGIIPDDELPYYYRACDLYTTASLWEGYNLPVAEAQACGKKVVAFDVGSHPEVVKNGILVKKGDVKAFAEAIIKSLKRTSK